MVRMHLTRRRMTIAHGQQISFQRRVAASPNSSIQRSVSDWQVLASMIATSSLTALPTNRHMRSAGAKAQPCPSSMSRKTASNFIITLFLIAACARHYWAIGTSCA